MTVDGERSMRRLSRRMWVISVACIGLWLTAGIVFAIAGNWPAAFSDLTFACLTAFYLWSFCNAENENNELRNRLDGAANIIGDVLDRLVDRAVTDMAGTNGQDDTTPYLPLTAYKRDDLDTEP
jgi:hypothetical protein